MEDLFREKRGSLENLAMFGETLCDTPAKSKGEFNVSEGLDVDGAGVDEEFKSR